MLVLSFYRVCSFSQFTGWVRPLILPGGFVLSFYRVGSASHYYTTVVIEDAVLFVGDDDDDGDNIINKAIEDSRLRHLRHLASHGE